jgi:hypothetical protein
MSAPAGAQEPVILQPHRIAYQVTLDPKRAGSAYSAAHGLMVLEFSGDGCAGYTTAFRQVMELAGSDGGRKQLDFNISLSEAGDGKRFGFRSQSRSDGRLERDAEGEAVLGPEGALSVAMRRPGHSKSDFDGNVEFPAALSVKMIRAALAGAKTFRARLFDGSEGGEKVYNTVVTIGPPLEGERNKRVEPVMTGVTLEGTRRWPVSIAYYDDQPGDRVPVYTMRNVTFANGVISDIVFEFADFSLAARATRYEALPRNESCRR